MRAKSRAKFFAAIVFLVILSISSFGAIFLLGQQPSGASSQNPTNSSTTPTNSQNSTNNPTPTVQVKIVNKAIPSGYAMGFPADGGLIIGMNVVFIENPNQRISDRFTAKLSGTVTRLVIYGFAFEGQPTVRVGLQGDNSGNPQGQWITNKAFGDIQLSSSSGFKEVQLGVSVALTKGQIYHVVIEAVQDHWSGKAAITTYQANSLAQPYNPDDPDITWSDSNMNTLFSNGQGWQEQNKWPIFVIEYSDGQQEGQPYSLIAQWVVYSSTYVGQTLIPASDYHMSEFAFVVGTGSGTPQDNLYYQVRDSSNKILAQGTFAQKGQLTNSQTWIEATLANPVTLSKGQTYRIIVLSPQTDLANAYYFFGHEFSFNAELGYGSLQHQLTSSLDGGSTWGEHPDADAVFRITNV